MRHHINCFTLVSIFLTAVLPLLTCVAQSGSKPSSLDSLNSNPLLGDSFNNQDFGKLPTNITSDTLTLHAKTRIFVYKGNVVVTQGDMKLTSKEIEGNYNEQNQIQKIVAKGDVVITKQDIEATSQRAIYDAVSSVITLTDNPQLKQGESILIADRIKVLLNENRSLAEGNVRVTFVKHEGTPIAGAGGTPNPTAAGQLVGAQTTPKATPTAAPQATPTAKSVAAKSGKPAAKKPTRQAKSAAKSQRK